MLAKFISVSYSDSGAQRYWTLLKNEAEFCLFRKWSDTAYPYVGILNLLNMPCHSELFWVFAC